MTRGFSWFAAAGFTFTLAPAPLGAQGESPTATLLPDWSGVWFTEAGAYVEISGFPTGDQPPPPSDGTPVGPSFFDPGGPWVDAARATLLERLVAQGATGKAEGWGYPMMMIGLTPIQFVSTPRETLIITSYRDLRHVMTDGRRLSAPEDRWVTAWGESVGHWEGDTLVIETVGVRQPNLFLISPPFTENAHYTERLRMTSPDRIEGEMTVVDPDSLTAPWTVPLAYVRAEGLDRLVYDTFTNDRSELEDGMFTIEPPGEATE